MSWNYRIVKYADGDGYGLHEVYYDERGLEKSMTEHPMIVGETPQSIRAELITIGVDTRRRPIFDEPKSWAESCRACRGTGVIGGRKRKP